MRTFPGPARYGLVQLESPCNRESNCGERRVEALQAERLSRQSRRFPAHPQKEGKENPIHQASTAPDSPIGRLSYTTTFFCGDTNPTLSDPHNFLSRRKPWVGRFLTLCAQSQEKSRKFSIKKMSMRCRHHRAALLSGNPVRTSTSPQRKVDWKR